MTENNTEKIIEITSLTKKFKSLTAVDNLNLSVYRGDVFGFLGPNGAGKSTTIRMLLSLITPTSGEINIFGMELNSNRNKILKRIGAIVEKPDFYGYLSAYKNLEILGSPYGVDVSKKRIMSILELVGLDKRYKSKVKTFSHGMKQRLGLAQALLHEPDLIILDEPTTGLDPQGMKEIRELIVHLSKDKGKTIFLSSHILSEVEIVANRMIIIDKGKTIVEGEVESLLKSSNLHTIFSVDDAEKAIGILKNSELNISAEHQTDSRILVSVEKVNIPFVIQSLSNNGINIYSVVPSNSLEDYFLSLTDKEKI